MKYFHLCFFRYTTGLHFWAYIFSEAKLFCQKVVLWNEAKGVNQNICGFKYFFFTLYVSLAWAKASSFFFSISNTSVFGSMVWCQINETKSKRNLQSSTFFCFHIMWSTCIPIRWKKVKKSWLSFFLLWQNMNLR